MGIIAVSQKGCVYTMKENNLFGERILIALKRLGMTQKELASKTGLNPVTISKYIKGETKPNIDAVDAIAKALNVSTDYLITGNMYSSEESAKDIMNAINTIINGLDNENGLMFNGKILDAKTAMLVKQSLENVQTMTEMFIDSSSNKEDFVIEEQEITNQTRNKR